MKRKNDNQISVLGKFNILCVDPSARAFGWTVINNGNIIEYGCIKTEPSNKKLRIRKGDDRVRRISEINKVLLDIIKKHKIVYMLSELPHGSQNAQAAMLLGMVAGQIQTISDFLGIGIEWYSEADAKKALLGRHTNVAKIEIIKAIDKLYKVPINGGIAKDKKGNITALWSGAAYYDEAVADSIAIYHVATLQSPVIKLGGMI